VIVFALNNLRPGAEWTCDHGTYEGITWHDTVQTKPTKEEIEAEIERLIQQYQSDEYKRKRAAEYPDFRDYLDGIVKGDQEQINAYIAACNAVKNKYPKG
jgi:hypothetical protein